MLFYENAFQPHYGHPQTDRTLVKKCIHVKFYKIMCAGLRSHALKLF